MTLTLRAVSLNDLPLSQPITASFDERGGTIGRADNNTMALPDPERHISRQQAEIRADRGGFLIRNVGSANPILVRSQTLSFGETAQLARLDRLRIGGYLLEVVEDGSDETTIVHGPAWSETPVSGANAQGSLRTPLSSDNPFADLFSTTPASLAAEERRAAPFETAGAGLDALPHLPDDFDPFAAPMPAPASAPRAVSTEAAGIFDDLLPRGAAPSIDEMFGLRPSDGRDPLADFAADVPTRARDDDKAALRATSVDPLVLFGAPPPRPPVAQATPDRTPDLHAAFVPPAVAQVRPRAEPAPAAAALPAAAARPAVMATPAVAARPPIAATAAWQAFCEGAGVTLESQACGDIEALRGAGVLLRQAIEGMLRLLAMRSTTRSEMHADMTMIRAHGNNPLKFSPDPQSAVEQMLRPPLRGFLPGPAAVADAMNDLVGHTIGTMTGTRAALDGLLDRFAPPQLEGRLASKGVLDALMPMGRKAKLWELYLQRYDSIRDEARDNFHELFGKAFLQAYEQQVDQLRREQMGAPRSDIAG